MKASDDAPAVDGPTTRETVARIRSAEHSSYVYLGKGRGPDDVTPDFVLAYDKPEHHGGGTLVLRGDGSTVFLEAEQVRSLLAELNTGHNPPRSDHVPGWRETFTSPATQPAP